MRADVKWSRFGRKQLRYYPGICLSSLKKLAQKFMRIAGSLPEIQTEHLPNMSPKDYHYTT
jgi:hypothetical protein